MSCVACELMVCRAVQACVDRRLFAVSIQAGHRSALCNAVCMCLLDLAGCQQRDRWSSMMCREEANRSTHRCQKRMGPLNFGWSQLARLRPARQTKVGCRLLLQRLARSFAQRKCIRSCTHHVSTSIIWGILHGFFPAH